MPDWLTATAAKVMAIVLAIALVLGLLWLKSCHEEQAAQTKADLATGQQHAATASGHDAVETLGNATTREESIQATVKEGTDAIQSAPSGDSNDAAERATCRMRSYRNSARCVSLFGPAPK